MEIRKEHKHREAAEDFTLGTSQFKLNFPKHKKHKKLRNNKH